VIPYAFHSDAAAEFEEASAFYEVRSPTAARVLATQDGMMEKS